MTAASVRVRQVLSTVTDPEIPVLTIEDLGVLRDVQVDDGHVVVTITPTYSGCPALQEIETDVRTALAREGWDDVEVRTALSPAWTTDWMSDEGRRRLREFGIAPPAARAVTGPVLVPLGRRPVVDCPLCGSSETEELARFSSTSCKAMWRCLACREPFDQFKSH